MYLFHRQYRADQPAHTCSLILLCTLRFSIIAFLSLPFLSTRPPSNASATSIGPSPPAQSTRADLGRTFMLLGQISTCLSNGQQVAIGRLRVNSLLHHKILYRSKFKAKLCIGA